MPLYADIVLPLAQPAYTFAVPEGMHVEAGHPEADCPVHLFHFL